MSMTRTKWVAPLVGAWIEMGDYHRYVDDKLVAPLVGAWIEITLWLCQR